MRLKRITFTFVITSLLGVLLAVVVLSGVARPNAQVKEGEREASLQVPMGADVPQPVSTAATAAPSDPGPAETEVSVHDTPLPYEPPPTPTGPVPTPPPPGWQDTEFSNPPTPEPPVLAPTHAPSDPINSSLYAERETRVDYSTIRSDVIVIATVKKVGPARWTTPDGARPLNPWAENNVDHIFTPITVKVEKVLADKHAKGVSPNKDLLLYGYGGTVGRDSLSWGEDDLYNFVEGDRVLLFLFKSDGYKPPAVVKLNLWDVYERFSITSDGKTKNSYHKKDLQQLLSEVDAALAQPQPTPDKK